MIVDGLALLHRELLLFAGFWLIVGLIDDLVVDLIWLVLVVRGGVRVSQAPGSTRHPALRHRFAVFVPAWQEADVIGITLRHVVAVWGDPALRVYVGCYANDPPTLAVVREVARGDGRLRVVVVGAPGPTTKAGCLNALYRALVADETAAGQTFDAVVLHDAEDMVHSGALELFDRELASADFVQLPVRAEPLVSSRWVAGHYQDEFAEAHLKAMVVRGALGAALPAAGVGCAIRRSMLGRIALAGPSAGPARAGPFAAECLTEDYEIGWRIARIGGRARFVRQRDGAGALIATRAFFPDRFDRAVAQKARWTHGIAYQGWDRLGWPVRPVDLWMALRDRRAPLAAVVLLAAYGGLAAGVVLAAGTAAGYPPLVPAAPWAGLPAQLCLLGLGWRLAARFACTAHEYGWTEGIRAVLRAPLANVIAIAAANRAL
ncbi:MAG: glycosyl transferase family protein, partial [Sphingomonadales bacterium]|nr:glycosyl transferase family protein [Sphingomonadales bacterium]